MNLIKMMGKLLFARRLSLFDMFMILISIVLLESVSVEIFLIFVMLGTLLSVVFEQSLDKR